MGHDDWARVGWALYNITEGSEEGLDIWITFSLRTEDHDEARCIYEWGRMQNRGVITLGTLKFYARTDNPAGYSKLIAEYQSKEKVINVSEKGLADLFAKHCQGEFAYCKNRWYEFRGSFWQETEEGINLKKRVCEILTSLLKEVKKKVSEDEEDEEGERKDKISRTLKALETQKLLRNVTEWCKISFHEQDFEDKLDKNRYLIGFKNGIFDLQLNVFRKGTPSDMIMNHMPIEYREYTENDDEVLEVKTFLEKIFPTPNLRRYFMDIMSELFVGYNHRKHVYFLTGEGDNGKSMTQMFFEKMLGKLSIKVPTTLLTSKKPALGSAVAELARAGGGVRAMWLEEPDADEEICQGILKHLSGNDTFYTRGLYQAGREIEPMFTMFVICNGLPKVKHGGDKATWNRIRVIKFESVFSKDAPKTPEEQLLLKKFPVDTTLDQRIPFLTQALAWLLLEHRKQPRIEDPPEVCAATSEYKETNDLYAQFAAECITAEEGCLAQDLLTLEYFKDFMKYAQGKQGALAPSQYDFVKIMSKYLGPLNENRNWVGYRLQAPRAAAFAEGRARAPQIDAEINEGDAKSLLS
jgi:P4 family phage/plasmid primase-like protien